MSWRRNRAAAQKARPDAPGGFWCPPWPPVAAFLLTENMRLPMAFADKWTILMAILAAAQLAVMLLARKNWEDQGDDNGQGAAPANA